MLASTPSDTQFAPAARLPLVEVQKQASLMKDLPLLDPMLDALPVAIMVLNEQRQILYANRQFAALLPSGSEGVPLGQRPGEALGCIHADQMEAGCGTSDFCRACGAIAAVLSAFAGQDSSQESRMTVIRDGKPVAIDLRVWARSFNLRGEIFCLVSALEISHEKQRRLLERIFFHDIANTAAVISGYADLMGSRADIAPEELSQMATFMAEAGHQLVDEIAAQRQLLSAERGDLKVEPQKVETANVLTSVMNRYRRHPLVETRQLRLDLNTVNIVTWTDGALLGRVVNNMVKNALEATTPGQTITLGCDEAENGVRFWVHNPGFIDPEVQRRIFQRSFSTKGNKRGLGTYGMKLLSEGYLRGAVSFTSSAAAGTTFSVTIPLDSTDQTWEETSAN